MIWRCHLNKTIYISLIRPHTTIDKCLRIIKGHSYSVYMICLWMHVMHLKAYRYKQTSRVGATRIFHSCHPREGFLLVRLLATCTQRHCRLWKVLGITRWTLEKHICSSYKRRYGNWILIRSSRLPLDPFPSNLCEDVWTRKSLIYGILH